jgi:uncharacterized protein (DUF1800 family)
MGQDLFEPPNVGGWPHGRAWAHSRGLIARANFAAALVSGPNAGRPTAYDPKATARAAGFSADAAGALTYHHRLLFGTDPSAEMRRRVSGANVATVLLSSPEAQLG